MIFNTDLSSGLTIKMSHGSGDQHRISHDELVNITNVTFNAGLLIEVFDTALFQINTKNSLIFQAVHDYGACNNYDLDDKGAESVKDYTLKRQASAIEFFMGEYFPTRKTIAQTILFL